MEARTAFEEMTQKRAVSGRRGCLWDAFVCVCVCVCVYTAGLHCCCVNVFFAHTTHVAATPMR